MIEVSIPPSSRFPKRETVQLFMNKDDAILLKKFLGKISHKMLESILTEEVLETNDLVERVYSEIHHTSGLGGK